MKWRQMPSFLPFSLTSTYYFRHKLSLLLPPVVTVLYEPRDRKIRRRSQNEFTVLGKEARKMRAFKKKRDDCQRFYAIDFAGNEPSLKKSWSVSFFSFAFPSLSLVAPPVIVYFRLCAFLFSLFIFVPTRGLTPIARVVWNGHARFHGNTKGKLKFAQQPCRV